MDAAPGDQRNQDTHPELESEWQKPRAGTGTLNCLTPVDAFQGLFFEQNNSMPGPGQGAGNTKWLRQGEPCSPGAQSLGEEKVSSTESYNSPKQKQWQRSGLWAAPEVQNRGPKEETGWVDRESLLSPCFFLQTTVMVKCRHLWTQPLPELEKPSCKIILSVLGLKSLTFHLLSSHQFLHPLINQTLIYLPIQLSIHPPIFFTHSSPSSFIPSLIC